MNTLTDLRPDVMQVCRNGHVITDLLLTCPERGLSHCDRCGAATLDHCPTCGEPFAGAIPVPGLVPVGRPRPPLHCAVCGAAFPWAPRSVTAAEPLLSLETLLRRLPRVVRQLRERQGGRPPFRVEDERDLEDLLRSLLPLYADAVRLEGRTPSYATGTRTDCLLDDGATALTVKRASAALRERALEEQLREDVVYYQKERNCRTLVVLVYDPEQLLVGPRERETAWSRLADGLEVRCVITS
jgi:hypothetical protein